MNQTLSILAAAGHAGGFGVHEAMLVGSTVIVVLVVVLLAVAARGQIGIVPKGLGAAFEHVFDWIDGMAQDMIGPAGRQYVPLLMSFFLFILFSNWSGLLPLPVLSYGAAQHAAAGEGLSGLGTEVAEDLQEAPGDLEAAPAAHNKEEHVMFEAPTASYNTTLALALISFFAFNWFGIKKNCFPAKSSHGHHHHEGDEHSGHNASFVGGFFNWLMHYVQPTPMLWRTMDGGMKYFLVPLLGVLFLCLNIMEEFARIVSLSLRLFGNISGEHQVKMTLMDVMRSFLVQGSVGLRAGDLLIGPAWLGVAGMIWGAALFATLLGALAGFVQAMVFTMLSLVYIQHAVADDH
jgi:F0F1-type ATP synthase membrane subunit a